MGAASVRAWILRKTKSWLVMVVVNPAMKPHMRSVPPSRRLLVRAAVPSPPTQSAAAYAPFPPARYRVGDLDQGQGSSRANIAIASSALQPARFAAISTRQAMPANSCNTLTGSMQLWVP